MRVVFAPDGFKGSLSAAEAASALAAGWSALRPGDTAELRPIADGGEGTLDAFAAAVPGARRMPVAVMGPQERPIEASWLLLPDGTGVVELASTSGIELLAGQLRGMDASTFGFGQAIGAALDHGVERLVLGIGSSASTDAGRGALSALGAQFFDAHGRPAAPGARGLGDVARVDLSHLRALPAGGALVLSDVTSPLCGPRGAAAVFGPQKGLSPEEVRQADAALAHIATLLPADPEAEGAGAAGGTGFGLLAWGARIVPGAAEVARLVGLAEAVSSASVVITGEGSFDAQSSAGKGPGHVIALAGAAGVPVGVAAGRIAEDATLTGVAASVSLTELAGSADAAQAAPVRWLRDAGARLARELA